MINKLAKVISAATVLAMAVSLAPQSALAGIGKASGPSVNASDTLLFEIDTSSPYIPDGANQGTFTQAIPKASFQNRLDSTLPAIIDFNPGDLKTSLIDLTPQLLQTLNTIDSSFKGKFDSKAVKYSARLEDDKTNYIKFEFYAPFTAPFTNQNSLSVFNASNLTTFLNPDGQVKFPKGLSDLNESSFGIVVDGVFSLTPAPDDVTKVPEPVATAGLLGFGIVSTALLRKRNKCLKATVSHSNR